MPTRQKDESRQDFLSRCMGDSKMVDEFPDNEQRYAVCNNYAEAAEAAVPTPNDGESHEVFMSRCMEMGYSEDECMAAHEGHDFEVEGYHHEEKKKASEDCGCGCCGAEVAYEDWGDVDVAAAEYQGRSVTLNKPFRTQGGPKKFGVYTKNEKGNVVLVRFGDPNMEIKRDDPERRRNFRSRHNCDNPGPKWKARYWSCRQWRGGKKSKPVWKIISSQHPKAQGRNLWRLALAAKYTATKWLTELLCIFRVPMKKHSNDGSTKTIAIPHLRVAAVVAVALTNLLKQRAQTTHAQKATSNTA